MSASLVLALLSMVSGQCRWIVREDIHAYCHAPIGREPRYCVVCPSAALDYVADYSQWVTATEAAALIGSIV